MKSNASKCKQRSSQVLINDKCINPILVDTLKGQLLNTLENSIFVEDFKFEIEGGENGFTISLTARCNSRNTVTIIP